jgi:hypothetical protein
LKEEPANQWISRVSGWSAERLDAWVKRYRYAADFAVHLPYDGGMAYDENQASEFAMKTADSYSWGELKTSIDLKRSAISFATYKPPRGLGMKRPEALNWAESSIRNLKTMGSLDKWISRYRFAFDYAYGPREAGCLDLDTKEEAVRWAFESANSVPDIHELARWVEARKLEALRPRSFTECFRNLFQRPSPVAPPRSNSGSIDLKRIGSE